MIEITINESWSKKGSGMTPEARLASIISHMKRVEDNCNRLAVEIMKSGKEEDLKFALELVKRGRMHDLSKLSENQFEKLWFYHPDFKIARDEHRSSERHHPEFHLEGIQGMNLLDLAEMVCDCLARAQEFGTDIREWFFDENFAPKKYKYIGDQQIYDKIKFFLFKIVGEPFEKNSIKNK